MAPFYGWGSTTSRLVQLQGGSLRFTTKFPDIPGTHFMDLGRMKGWVDLEATREFTSLRLRICMLLSCHICISRHSHQSTLYSRMNVKDLLADFWTSRFLSRGCKYKLLDTCDVDLSIKVLDFHFLFI